MIFSAPPCSLKYAAFTRPPRERCGQALCPIAGTSRWSLPGNTETPKVLGVERVHRSILWLGLRSKKTVDKVYWCGSETRQSVDEDALLGHSHTSEIEDRGQSFGNLRTRHTIERFECPDGFGDHALQDLRAFGACLQPFHQRRTLRRLCGDVADEVSQNHIGINQMCLRARRHAPPLFSHELEWSCPLRPWRSGVTSQRGDVRSQPAPAGGGARRRPGRDSRRSPV